MSNRSLLPMLPADHQHPYFQLPPYIGRKKKKSKNKTPKTNQNKALLTQEQQQHIYMTSLITTLFCFFSGPA